MAFHAAAYPSEHNRETGVRLWAQWLGFLAAASGWFCSPGPCPKPKGDELVLKLGQATAQLLLMLHGDDDSLTRSPSLSHLVAARALVACFYINFKGMWGCLLSHHVKASPFLAPVSTSTWQTLILSVYLKPNKGLRESWLFRVTKVM